MHCVLWAHYFSGVCDVCVCVYVCRCEPATCWWSTGTRGEPAPGERPPSPAARRRPSSYSWVTRRRLSTRRRHLRIWPPATVTAAQPKRYRSDNWGGVRRIFVWMVGKQGFPLKHLKYRQVLRQYRYPYAWQRRSVEEPSNLEGALNLETLEPSIFAAPTLTPTWLNVSTEYFLLFLREGTWACLDQARCRSLLR